MSDKQAMTDGKYRPPGYLIEWTVELAALFFIAAIAGPLIYDWIDANSIPVRMSVLWIPVAVLALQYGLLSGLVAAAIAFAIYALQNDVAINVGEGLDAFALRVGLEPLLWTVAAAFLGGVRAMAEERALKLERELAEEQNTVAVMSERYSRLRDRVEFLERSLTVGRDPHMRQNIHKADALVDMSAEDCRDSLYEVLTSASNGATLTLVICTETARVKLPPTNADMPMRSGIPPAAIFPATDAMGRTILEVHVERIDPDHFTLTDQIYFFELCERIGAILDKRGTVDLYRLAMQSVAA